MSLKSMFKSIYIFLAIVFLISINSYGVSRITTKCINYVIFADDIKLLTPAGPFCVTDAPVNLSASTPGGTWSGNGITDPILGTFDPSIAGVGDHTITYTSVSGTENMTIHVDAAVNATITGVGPFCDNDNLIYLSAVSPGGTWSGTGILNPLTGEFDPETAGFGTHIIQYDVTNGACNDSDTESIEIFESPDATYPPIPDVCETDPPFDIIPNSPGGTWSGTGITNAINGTFDPATAGPGAHMITYSISNANCTSTQVRRINVDTLVIATITPAGPFCDTDAELNLSAFHNGGTWSGTGITNPSTGAFDPSIAGIGTHTVTYEIISGACEDIDNVDIDVLPTPDPTITDPGEFCSNDPAILLNAADPGGTWAGPGITNPANGTFDPAAANDGANNITYTITNAGCTVVGNITIYVYDAAVDATITSSGPLCISDGLITLNAVSPGGTWSGTGIVDPANGIFDTDVAGIGSHVITYDVGNPACFDTDSETFQVDDSLSAIITPAGPVCETDAPFNFTAANAGGVWSGTGITDPVNGTFNPLTAGGGTHTITYTISQGACTNIDNFDITVDAIVDATITPAGPFCQNDAPTNLIAVSAGGTWSGTGITDPVNGVFNPTTAGPGNHTITYIVTNGTCSDSDTEQISVDLYPDSDWTDIGPFCETDFAVNIVPNNPTGTFSGIGITNPLTGTFNPQIAGDGIHSISYTIINGTCTSITTKPVIVDQSVDATITPAGPFCETDSPVDLVAADAGGTWSGTGITNPANGTFNPAIANPGTHTITYSVVNGACSDLDTEDIAVDVFPDSDWTNIGPFCEFEPSEDIIPINPGGVFSGNGITDPINGTFDPTIAGQGTHQITYTLVNGVCSSVTTKPVIVYSGVNPTITPAGPFCDNINALLLSASQPGGTWSGTGIVNASLGAFDPVVAGPGIHEIVYELSNANCTNSDTTYITVYSSPDASFAPVFNICETDPAFDLIPNTPGGTWSGVGIIDVVNGTFDPSVAGAGSHMITYTISNINCTSSKVRRLDVDPPVDATITPVGPFCEDEAEVILTSVDPGGTWTGNGITNSSTGAFNPAIAGAGLHTITYGLAVGACEDTATIDIQVDFIPDATINPAGPFCENDPALDLTPVTPGGVWSGTGITNPANGTFDPSVSGTGDFAITYDLTNGACSSQGNTNIHVDVGVDATITPVAPVCESDAAFDLVAADPGGIWSGTGITNAVNGTFDPAIAGPGLHIIDYNITNGTCSDSDSQTIEVSAEPDASIAPAGPFCSNDPAINLIPTTPGGTWAGTGITDVVNGTFDPTVAGSGDFFITYDLINGACTEQGSINIHVDDDVDATITTTGPVCVSDAAFNFSAVDGGGVWSGTGITNPANGTFDPIIAGVGFHTIDYNITNGVCSDSDSYIMEVNSEPDATVNAAGPFCESDAPVNLTATTPGGTWSGTGITDAILGTFDPATAGGGDFTIFYDLTNGACTEQGSINIHVDNDVDATITPVAPVCESDAAFDFVAVDPGGIWSGTGITNPANGTFDPAIAGVGFHTIDYNITNGVCSDSDSYIMEVNSEPDATVNAAGPFCESDAPVNLTATTPGGTWSGTGITDAILGTFDPATAGGGDFTIFYDLTNGACTEQGSINIHVDNDVDATITPVAPVCESDAAFDFVAVDPGGIWSGTGITNPANGTFDPAIAGVGFHTIDYNISNGVCSDSDSFIIEVSAEPDATVNAAGPFCESDAPVNLTATTPGGTWSGTGITDAILGTFDPAIAGGGDFTIFYDLTNGACTKQGTITIHVDDEVDATITAVGPFCQFDAAVVLNAVSPGGVWSGSGITDINLGVFNPSVAGVGTVTINYNVVNGQCSDSDNTDIDVLLAPDGTINDPGEFCSDDLPVNLTAATPGGVWSGTGITNAVNGTFDPSVANDGANNILYTVSNADCTTIGSITIYVYDAAVDATITTPGPYCISDGLITLSAVSSGGIWSGVGIIDPVNGTFDPNVAGIGAHAITYDVGNPACFDTDTQMIQVDDSLSAIITPVATLCENSAAFNFAAADAGGIWSGTGITDPILGTFNPSTAGDGTHVITYTINSGACTNIDTFDMIVDANVDATITAAGPFCENDAIQTLISADAGGTWSGAGIVNPATGQFHPNVAGHGDHVIQYDIVNGTCSDSDTETIHIDALPNTTITPAGPYCENDAAINLVAATGGGTWSGTGITDAVLGTFNPSTAGGGNHLITYELTIGACTNSSNINILVDDFYDATITPAGPFCDNGAATTLTAASSGGTWSGTGITNPANGTFHPGVSGDGDFVIQYQITNGTCSDSDNITIHVDEYQNTTITPAGPFCEDAASVNLTAATPGGTWSGNGITDAIIGTFDPATAGNGNHLIGYEITNGACTSSSSTTIQVDDFLDATITPAGPFCDNGAATTLTAASSGGTWSGTGITNPANGTFHPGVSGDGDFVIQYQITNGTCSDSDNITIHVDEYQNTTITPAGPFCEDAASVNLTAATPGGTWSGNGITDAIIGTFDPATAGNGNHLIGYEITNGACTSSSSTTIQVDDFLDATITPSGPYCNNGSAVTLVAATSGGTWSGTGITNPANGTFHPGIAGPGDFVIDYQITNGLCSDSDNITIHVDEYFDASILAISDFCETDAIVDLTSLNPGGTWSGNGIIVPANGTFDPSGAGAGDHIITYEITTGACYSTDSETVHVDAQPDPTITPAGPLCANEPSFDLTAAQTGGLWSGIGITNTTNGTFNASVAGAGDHVITYEIINGVCSANDTEIIHVDSNPNTVLSTVGPFCETDAAVDLVEPSPGGTWSGTGITNITTGIFDPAFATDGTYLITYTNINGACVSSGTTNITVDALVDATITDVGPFCETDPSVVLTAVSPGGNWAGIGIVNPITGVFNPLNAGVGTHTITYSVTNGACSDTDDTQIIVEDSPEVNILTTGPFCENEGNQLFIADVAGGVWSGNGIDMTGNFSPSTAGDGIHPISYTLTSGSCVVVETVNITVDQFVDAEITSTGPFCFNDTPDYLTSLNPGGVWSGDGISFDGLFSPAGAGVGTHTITYEITNGACFDDDTQDILVKSNPDPTISGPWDVCENEPPFNYTAATSGGLWSGTGFTDVVAGTFSPQLSGVGGFLIVYQVTVDGCSSIDFDTLNVHELPVVTISGLNSDYCINDEAVLVNVSPAGGVLSGGNIVGTLFDPEVAGVGTHLIEYVYSDANSCSNTASFTVEVHDIPTVSISGIDPTYCIYEDTVYPALLPIGGTFEGPGTFNDVGFVPALAGPGDFELIYHFTDIFGCSDTSYVNTTVFDYANIEFESTQTQCFGDSTGSAIATVTGYDPFDYLWSDYTSSMTNEIVAVPSGWYYLSVTDNNLCITIDSVFVDQPPQLIAEIASSVNVSCFGLEDASVLASASGGTPDYEFLWNNFPPSDTSFIDSLPVGTYIVTVTDANMCTATDTAFIIEPDTLSLSFIDIFNVSCYGNSDGSVTVEPQGGTEPYTAFWNDDSSTIGLTVENLEAGYYTVTVIDENDCQISDSVLITQPAPIYIEIDITPVICNQQTGSIEINAFGGTEPYEYLWSTSANDTLPVLLNVLSQDYSVIIQDANNCMIDTTIFVPSEGGLTAIITQTEYNLCYGDKIAELIAHTPLAAMPVYYDWSNFILDSVNPNLPAGEYSVTITDSWGCFGIDSITVSEPELLVAEVSSINILCKGELSGVANVEITGGTPDYEIEWHTGDTGYTLGNLGPGEASVIVTDANNCRTSGSSFITEPETGMVVNFNIKHVTCNGAEDGAINAFATGGNPPYWYTWFINGVEINEPSIRNLGGGFYTLQVSDNFGCITDTIIQIYEVNTLIANTEVGATSCIGNHDGYIAVIAGGGTPPYSYYLMDMLWDSYIIDSLYRGDYYITVRDSNDCELNLGPIFVPDTEIDCLRIPAAFSPNGDGHNDEFYIENIHLYPRSMVQIYNRWGQLLYEDRGINGFWDGTYNGNPVPTGAYLYHIMLNIDEDPRVGTVTVVR